MSADTARPSGRVAAEALYAALVAERTDGFLPEHTAIGVVCSADEEHVYIQIGGLSDDFVLGNCPEAKALRHAAHLSVRDLTSEARRLYFQVIDAARENLPRKPSGELWFGIGVWLMTEPFWASPQFSFDGVTTLGKGNPQ